MNRSYEKRDCRTRLRREDVRVDGEVVAVFID